MRILVFGAGAVGCYIGGHLALAGHSVTLLGRERVTRAIQEHGLTIKPADKRADPIAVRDILTVTSFEEALHTSPGFDLALFTMKAYDTALAAEEFQRHLAGKTPVVCMQNGIGNEGLIESAVGAGGVVAGAMTTAVSMSEPGAVVEETERGIALAADSPSYAAALAAFAPTRLRVGTVHTTASLKWSKLITNLICNATSAILDMPPVEIMRGRDLFAVEVQALRETLSIMKLHNIPVADMPGAPATILAFLLRSMPLPALQPLLRAQFASARGDKLPSLAVALRAHHTRTEVAWLNGAVAQAAKEIGRLAPINHALALLVSDIASGRVPWEMYRHSPSTLLAAVHAAQGNSRWRYGE